MLRQLPMHGLLFLALAVPSATNAQVATVAVERENFRAAPNGTVVAEVMEGTELRIGETRDRWRQATLEGWIWTASVRSEAGDGHDLIVTPGGGENLRAEPNGTVLARLRAGASLERVEGDGNWTRVRRTAWIWEPSLTVAASAARPAEPVDAAPATAVPAAAAAPAATDAADAAPGGSDAVAAGGRDFATAGSRGLVVLTQPAGDTLASVHRGATVQVLARDGDWARVRVEGWTFTAGVTEDSGEGGVVRDVGRAELIREPARYRGRLIEWDVQFIALQHAERYRTDFIEGEPFILAKGPGDDAGFVYLAVPPEQLEAVRRLAPLQRIRVLGRIRTARSALTDAPVLDLLDLTIQQPAPRR